MRAASPENKAHYARKRSDGGKKAWETIKRKKASRQRAFREVGKRVAAIIREKQWEPGKVAEKEKNKVESIKGVKSCP